MMKTTFWVLVLAYLNSTIFDLQTGNGTASAPSKYNCNSHCLIFNEGGGGGGGLEIKALHIINLHKLDHRI